MVYLQGVHSLGSLEESFLEFFNTSFFLKGFIKKLNQAGYRYFDAIDEDTRNVENSASIPRAQLYSV